MNHLWYYGSSPEYQLIFGITCLRAVIIIIYSNQNGQKCMFPILHVYSEAKKVNISLPISCDSGTLHKASYLYRTVQQERGSIPAGIIIGFLAENFALGFPRGLSAIFKNS